MAGRAINSKDEKLPTPPHCNGHLICAIDTETTGLVPGYNDLVQMAIVPLNDKFQQNKAVPIFYIDLKPVRPENAHPKAMQVNGLKLANLLTDGMDPFQAADLFETWFKALGLGPNKKIMPLGHNYKFDEGFLREWLGDATYEQFFHYEVRDTKSVALFHSDKTWWKADDIQFPKRSLSYVAGRLGIQNERAHDALGDAVTTAEVYRRLLCGPPL